MKIGDKTRDLEPHFRRKVERIVHDLAAYLGVLDAHVASGRRTVAEQKKLVSKGYSKTMRSKHLSGRAADIVPRKQGWNAPKSYWLKLGYLAEREGLRWGGFYGLSRSQRAALRAAYKAKDWEAPVKVGWDPAHVETRW